MSHRKSQKKNARSKKTNRRYPGRNHHHLVNRCNNGRTIAENLLLIETQRHICWHHLFGNLSLVGAIKLLLRVYRAKHHERVEKF